MKKSHRTSIACDDRTRACDAIPYKGSPHRMCAQGVTNG